MKASSRKKVRPRPVKKTDAAAPCTEPGHCPPNDPPAQTHQATPPRLPRRVPPEAERRAFEDAINGWWWL